MFQLGRQSSGFFFDMNTIFRLSTAFLLIFAFFINALPCGPAYVSPVFDYKKSPEDPFENFAAGKIGIVKPTYHRSVLFAAYRYVNGGSFSADEQKSLVEVWRADFNNKSYDDADTSQAVKKWVETRKDTVDKEEKTPEIYVEREYGGYDFFPNCTTSAFETAAATLASRVASYGAQDKNVKDWVRGQDQVFTNCASGRQIPAEAGAEASDWLKKDRAYQIAAAEFYSLNYEDAKNRFAEIAQDFESPWRETAEYLVGRTLIRQASLAKSEEKAKQFYAQAEEKLQNLASGHKYADSAERLVGLVKYRLRPEERAVELGQKLSYQSGNQNFRQDLIDYTWLLDKFEKEGLESEEKRREAEKPKEPDSSAVNMSGSAANIAPSLSNAASTGNKKNDDDLQIYLYSDDYQKNWTFFVDKDATDEDALAEAERVVGAPLTEEMKKRVRASRQSAYQGRFTSNRQGEYEGGYYGDVEKSLSYVPEFLRRDELTDWLYAYQITDAEAYLYALSKFRQMDSDLWLMTAISKADKNSTELKRVLDAAQRANRTSPAFPTIAYHTARLEIELGRETEAKKMLDEMLAAADDLPISTVNQFLDLRVKLAATMDEFFKYSLRRPFAFDMDGQSGTIDEIIAEQKSWYDPKYSEGKSREEYEREVEERFKNEKLWQDRAMFDGETINVINQHFPLAVMIEAIKSETLPDYLKGSFVMAIWTKAVVTEDYATAKKIEPDFLKYHPEFQAEIEKINAAKTPAQKRDAYLYFLLKNPIVTPFLEDGFDKTDNEANQFDANDWWCAPYDMEYDDAKNEDVPARLPARPKFLTEAQTKIAQAERKKLGELGDAPKFFADRVFEWQKRAPADRRVPESLFITYEANGWKKFSCGNNVEIQEQIGDLMRKRYAGSEWTRKLSEEQQ